VLKSYRLVYALTSLTIVWYRFYKQADTCDGWSKLKGSEQIMGKRNKKKLDQIKRKPFASSWQTRASSISIATVNSMTPLLLRHGWILSISAFCYKHAYVPK
jgi:hypothetical protein